MYLCLTTETREILKAYIQTLPQEDEWLFPGYNGKGSEHLGESQPYVILKDLCTKANITSKNARLPPIRFHCLRQYFSRKYGGRPEIKEFCMGHVPRYNGAYSVTEQEIWRDFKTQDEALAIQEKPYTTKLVEQTKQIENLQKENAVLKQRIDDLLIKPEERDAIYFMTKMLKTQKRKRHLRNCLRRL